MSPDLVVLRRVRLTPEHRPSGRTVHRAGDRVLPCPAELAIGRYNDAPGVYLFYLAADGTELTDTFHDEIEAALEQAEFEFGVKPSEWTVAE